MSRLIVTRMLLCPWETEMLKPIALALTIACLSVPALAQTSTNPARRVTANEDY